MTALLGVVKGASKSKTGPARGDQEKTPEKPKGFRRGTFVRITVPLSPKPAKADTKELVVYVSKPGIIFVEAADLPWLLHYMYEENQGKRVPEPIDDDGADDALDENRPWTTRWAPLWDVDSGGQRRITRRPNMGLEDSGSDRGEMGHRLCVD